MSSYSCHCILSYFSNTLSPANNPCFESVQKLLKCVVLRIVIIKAVMLPTVPSCDLTLSQKSLRHFILVLVNVSALCSYLEFLKLEHYFYVVFVLNTCNVLSDYLQEIKDQSVTNSNFYERSTELYTLRGRTILCAEEQYFVRKSEKLHIGHFIYAQ